MPNGQQPTNADILKEIRDMSARVLILESWKTNEDAYRAALAQIKLDQENDRFTGLRDGELKRRTEVMKQIGIILGLIVVILYAYTSTHGIHP